YLLDDFRLPAGCRLPVLESGVPQPDAHVQTVRVGGDGSNAPDSSVSIAPGENGRHGGRPLQEDASATAPSGGSVLVALRLPRGVRATGGAAVAKVPADHLRL